MKKEVGDYYLVSEIGRGQSGTVFLATLRNDPSRYFAIRAIPRQPFVESSPIMNEISKSEASLLKKTLASSILPLIALLKTSSNYYYVMPFCEGGSLGRLIEKRKGLPEREALGYFSQIYSAVKEMLSIGLRVKGFRVNDVLLKGSSLMVKFFGFSKLGYENQALEFGDLIYEAPETIFCTGLTDMVAPGAAECWALGICLYRMIYNGYPYGFESNSGMSLELSLKAIIECRNGSRLLFQSEKAVSSECRDLVTRLLEPDPAKRILFARIDAHPALEIFRQASISKLTNGALEKSIVIDSQVFDKGESSSKELNVKSVNEIPFRKSNIDPKSSPNFRSGPVSIQEMECANIRRPENPNFKQLENNIQYVQSLSNFFAMTMKEARKLAKLLICDTRFTSLLAFSSTLLLQKSIILLKTVLGAPNMKEQTQNDLRSSLILQEKYLKHVLSNFVTEFDSKEMYIVLKGFSSQGFECLPVIDNRLMQAFVTLKTEYESLAVGKEWKKDICLVITHIYYCLKFNTIMPARGAAGESFNWEGFSRVMGTPEFYSKPKISLIAP
jgi:serine/threonine protein kinase